MLFNLPRECIRNYFPSRKCFTFPQPVVGRDELKRLETVPTSQLDKEFVQVSQQYADYILRHTTPKSVAGRVINGRSKITT